MSGQISAPFTGRVRIPTALLKIPGSDPTVEGSSIEVEDLWKIYGAHPDRAARSFKEGAAAVDGHLAAVGGVSFRVEPGETFVVMGLSGSGKSTLIRCLTRLIEPTAGTVRIDGQDVLRLSTKELASTRRSDWAMVFQHFGLLPHRRVLSNVIYPLEISGMPKAERTDLAEKMIELVGLSGTESKYPHQLSGGMRQRVGLARALVQNPRLLLLDEPFSALDPLIRADLQDELLRLARAGRQTSVFITHDFSEALKVGDRIAIMKDGKLVQVGTPEELVIHPADDYVRRFALDAPRAKVLRAGAVAQSVYRASADDAPEAIIEGMRREGSGAALIRDEGGVPTLVSELDLLRARVFGTSVRSELPPPSVQVDENDHLSVVMDRLNETKEPVLVVTASGGVLGYVDAGAVIATLTDPFTVEEG